jgi:hypothetical protein
MNGKRNNNKVDQWLMIYRVRYRKWKKILIRRYNVLDNKDNSYNRHIRIK